jgi:hypothetical protein
MKNSLVIIAAVLIFVGCRPAKEVHTYDRQFEADTTIFHRLDVELLNSATSINVSLKNDLLNVTEKREQEIKEAVILDTDTIELNNSTSTARAWVENGELNLVLFHYLDSVPLQSRIFYRDKKEIIETFVDKPIAWYVWAIIGALVLALLIAIIR